MANSTPEDSKDSQEQFLTGELFDSIGERNVDYILPLKDLNGKGKVIIIMDDYSEMCLSGYAPCGATILPDTKTIIQDLIDKASDEVNR